MNSTQDNGTSHTTQTSSEPTHSQVPEAAARLAEELLETGDELSAVWVRHGLDVGRLALRTQSAWLKGLSTLLAQVADAIPAVSAHEEHATPPANATRE